MTINERLFALLEQKNLKQSDLAKHLNVRNSVITAWKTRGNNPPAEYLIQICEFLNVSINDLLGLKNDIVTINENKLDENELELLSFFKLLPEREQIKWIARLEDAAKPYLNNDDARGKNIVIFSDWKRKHKK